MELWRVSGPHAWSRLTTKSASAMCKCPSYEWTQWGLTKLSTNLRTVLAGSSSLPHPTSRDTDSCNCNKKEQRLAYVHNTYRLTTLMKYWLTMHDFGYSTICLVLPAGADWNIAEQAGSPVGYHQVRCWKIQPGYSTKNATSFHFR